MRLIDADKLIEHNKTFVGNVIVMQNDIEKEPVVDAIPIQFIKDKIDDYHYIAERTIPKVRDKYYISIRELENLLSNWETFGGKWERGEVW